MLDGTRVEELGVLTLTRPQAAVPWGGMYRMIDFAMRNLMHSGIDRVGIVAQYRPCFPMDHVGVGTPCDFLGRTRELTILSPTPGKKTAIGRREPPMRSIKTLIISGAMIQRSSSS